MRTGVVYLLTGAQLAARLVVSIYSLRKWYGGPITVFTTRAESHEIGQLMRADRRLRINHLKGKERPVNGYASSYVTKTAILKDSPYRGTVFLDADTLIVGELSELFSAAVGAPVTATCFCNWTTNEPRQWKRLKLWRRVQNKPGDVFGLERLLDLALETPFPAINSGVFAVQRDSPFVETWNALSWHGRTCPCADEVALQLLLPTTTHFILGSHFNAHPFEIADTSWVRIWHFAGGTHLERIASDLWLPAYDDCYKTNVAQIRAWSRIQIRSRSTRPMLAQPRSVARPRL